MGKREIEELFQHYSFWDKLTENEKDLLKRYMRCSVYKENQMVSGSGSDCLGLFYVCSGTIRVYLISEDGKEATVRRLHEGELCMLSGSCLLSSVAFDVQIDAECESEICILPSHIMKKIMSENIYVENFVYKKMNESFSDIIAATQKMLFASLEQRLAGFLIDEAAREHSDRILMTQEQIARAIGSAREAVSRTLKQMVSDGTVELFRGGVRILDRKKLYHII